ERGGGWAGVAGVHLRTRLDPADRALAPRPPSHARSDPPGRARAAGALRRDDLAARDPLLVRSGLPAAVCRAGVEGPTTLAWRGGGQWGSVTGPRRYSAGQGA